MQRKYLSLLFSTLAGVLLALSTAPQAQAQDKKADPTGTWNWSVPGRNGGSPRQSTLKLKLEGEKVTGTLASPGRGGGAGQEIAIENGKMKGDEVSFAVTREFNGNKFTQKYSGKVSENTIKGKIEFERNGEPQERPWEAKRAGTEKKASETK